MLTSRKLIGIFEALFVLVPLGCDCQAPDVQITINGSTPIFQTDPLSPSVALGMTIFKHRWTKYFNNPKLLTLSRGLGRSYLRVGGTRADHAHFIPSPKANLHQKITHAGDMTNCLGRMPNQLEFNQHKLESRGNEEIFRKEMENGVYSAKLNVTYTGQQFDNLMKFTKCANWVLIFGLNLLTRKSGNWDPTNTLQLLDYAKRKQYKIYWELGNEPNAYSHKEFIITSKDVAKAFYQLNEILKADFWWKDSKLAGPDVDDFDRASSRRFLRKFVHSVGNVMDFITFHQYYLDGREATIKNFTDPSLLNTLIDQVKNVVKIVRNGGYNSEIWLDETSSAFGGGAKGLSNTYVSGFMWLDKLGICSKYGVRTVFRQALFQSNYGLLDDNFDPRPDYWLTLLYKRLVGPTVLNVSVEGTDQGGERVRLYAHCTNTKRSPYPAGSITVYYLNLSPKEQSVSITFMPYRFINAGYMYKLTSDPNNLNSSNVYLNGEEIRMPDIHTLPILSPITVYFTPANSVTLPRMSYGFLVLPTVHAPACV